MFFTASMADPLVRDHAPHTSSTGPLNELLLCSHSGKGQSGLLKVDWRADVRTAVIPIIN